MYARVCPHVGICVCVFVYMPVCVYMHMCVGLCMCVFVHKCAGWFVCVLVHVCMCTCVYISLCVCVSVCVYVCMHPHLTHHIVQKLDRRKFKRYWLFKYLIEIMLIDDHCFSPCTCELCNAFKTCKFRLSNWKSSKFLPVKLLCYTLTQKYL